MTDQHCRVTVVGEHRRVDLALPARAPIAEYVMTLAGMCEQPDDDVNPAAWSLATAGHAPLSLASSLDTAGVTDGQVLYLRDITAGDADEPVIRDIDETVAEVTGRFDRWAWTPAARAVTQLAVAGGWLLATALVLAFMAPHRGSPLPGVLALAGAICAISLAACAYRRRWPVPVWLPRVLAVSAIAEFAVAGRLLVAAEPASGGRPGALALATAAGAAAGSLAALAAVPSTVTLALPLLAVPAVAAAATLAALHASATESVAVVCVIAVGLGSFAPWSAGHLVAYSPFENRHRITDPDAVDDQVRRAWILLAAWNSVLGATEAGCLLRLGMSASPIALALAGCVSLSLLLHAGEGRQLFDVVPVAVAGTVGVFTLALAAPERFGAPWWTGPLACSAAGALLLLGGVALAFRRAPGRRPGWFTPVANLLGVASVPLMVAVFGVFGHLANLGHHL